MAEKKESSSSGGAGLSVAGLLFVCLVVMKLAEIGAVAHWPWWQVFAAPVALIGIIIAAYFAVIGLILLVMLVLDGKRR